MRQAVMTAPGVIELREVPVPEAQKDTVVVEIAYIGVCGSDIHVYHGKHPYTSYPVVQGHEVSGKVVAVGPEVKDIKVGDRVTIEPQVACGTCYPCTHGLYNICNNLKVLGFQTTGTASDYFAISEHHIVKLPDGMDYRFGAMIEPLAVGVRAVQKAGDVKDKQILIIGAGPIGNLVAQTVKAMGASKVMVSDVNSLRLEKALACGIDVAVNVKEEKLIVAIEREFGAERRADIIFDCAGVQPAISSAVSVARKGSDIVVVAVYEGVPQVDLAYINECEIRIIGTARYNFDDFKTAIRLVGDGLINLEALITDVYEMPEYLEAYRKIATTPDSTMKVLVHVHAS
ncbi:MAG: alcohol dehydrogenase [Spirochaetae bacterium HGW-Spirochaetae-2]|jgi:L-iditol 2-dehydrogenase|nr:MAG: alcohol dehydrogenase [Spirochaetae bacterium HGW-Spirochaetae-2]